MMNKEKCLDLINSEDCSLLMIVFILLNQYDIVIGSNLQFYDRASGENMGTKEHLGRPWIPIGNHN